MHDFYRGANVSALQKAQFSPDHLPEMAMRPDEAVKLLTRNQVEYLPLDEVEGRLATTLWVVYPPGIATSVPGERLGARAKPMLDYLKMFEKSANLFPGFEAEIQGLYREIESDGSTRFYTYVVKE
jgi:arginine/lysine/ornithine decarboxylase